MKRDISTRTQEAPVPNPLIPTLCTLLVKVKRILYTYRRTARVNDTSTIAIIVVAIVIVVVVVVPIFIIINQVPSKTDLAMAALAFSGLLPVLIAGIVIIVFMHFEHDEHCIVPLVPLVFRS